MVGLGYGLALINSKGVKHEIAREIEHKGSIITKVALVLFLITITLGLN